MPANDESRTSKAEWGSDVIVETLRDLGVEFIALNPGATFRGVHDSIVNYLGNKNPELILCPHEEIAVAVAHGYGKAAGKPMAAYVHNVVGLLHASMAIYNAWANRSSMLVLGGTGPMAADGRRPWIDWIHTANVQGNAVRDFVKWDDQPASIGSSVESLIRGYQITTSAPEGPVYICFDVATQEEKIDTPFVLPDISTFPKPTRIQADLDVMNEAVNLLISAKCPVVMADFIGKSSEAANSLVHLAELLAIPVISGGDLYNFPTNHPLNATNSKRELIEEADVVLALDVYDLQQSLTGQDYTSRKLQHLLRPECKLIDISLRQLSIRSWTHDYGGLYPTTLSVQADISVALPLLTELIERRLDDGIDRSKDLYERYKKIEFMHNSSQARFKEIVQKRSQESPIALPFLASEMWEVIKDLDWVLGNGNLRGWTERLWDYKHPYQVIDSRGGGGLGMGFGHALGVALANKGKGRLTINIQSDGDFLFTPAAVWTAVHHKIPMLVVMYNNRTYGNDLGHQSLMAKVRGRPDENKTIGIDIDDPYVDFAAMARSFGAWAEGPIENPLELRGALERAKNEVINNGKLALLDVITELGDR
ncbi:MAG: thiamine pyrophosphate-binding protein [SAR202 cluster bacterium]|nr:thiamine pyrophosphate-binding protein [SAR202 cluster bacterium]|tara:strand:+ start:15493 stop:17277 length:1785 start_codon:yes stop_codon:yes gene_type:complete